MQRSNWRSDTVTYTMTTTTTQFKDPNYKPLPGHLGNLDASQQSALEQLKKELVTDEIWDESRMDDLLLLRFFFKSSSMF
jgi:hypothetical protein